MPNQTVRNRSGIALTAIAALTLAGCGRTPTAQASKREGDPKPIAVAVVHKASVPRAVDVVGTLAAVDQVTVSSEADGRVEKIHADLGDRVRAGQVLIQLDDEKQRYALEQQQADLARALAQYGAPDPEHLPDIEQTPEAKRTKADLAQATQSLDRANELFKRTLIPQQALDDARTAVETKKASYDASLHNARNLRASIQASQATMKLAGRQLRDAEIRAPFDGYVEKRLVNLGELVKAQMPVMAIVRLDPLKVIAEIPEKMAPWITDGRSGRAACRCLSRPDIHRKGHPDQPGGEHRDARVFVRGGRAQPRRGAEARNVRPRPRRERQGGRRPDRCRMPRFSTATASIACSSCRATGWRFASWKWASASATASKSRAASRQASAWHSPTSSRSRTAPWSR